MRVVLSVPRAATVAALTDNGGGASNDTLEKVDDGITGAAAIVGTDTLNRADLNTALSAMAASIDVRFQRSSRNFADLSAKANAVRTALRDAGLMA